MRPLRIAASLLALSTGIAPLSAQIVDLATDSELQAAYCVGVLQTGPKTAKEEAKIGRFKAYLAARGAFTINRSRAQGQGLTLAAETGHSDALACNQRRESCTARCLAAVKGSADEKAHCGVNCEAIACAGPDRCAQDNPEIPF